MPCINKVYPDSGNSKLLVVRFPQGLTDLLMVNQIFIVGREGGRQEEEEEEEEE